MRHPFVRLPILPLALALAGAAAADVPSMRAQLVVSGLAAPLFATAPAGDSRLFAVERAGRVQIVRDGAISGTFLDIRDRVGTSGEGGLLGLAFAPDYAASGRFYVYYTDLAGDSVLARYAVSANPDVADPTETRVLWVDQPDGRINHKGGTLGFGPDGQLYLGLGDGGGNNDPDELAQNGDSLLGKLLRLDVSGAGAGYAIPPDNPFVGAGPPRDEIWSLGLRNPYRWSFDRETGDLWIADVGQAAREEIDFEPADDPGGRNWGWDVMEGTLCNPNDPAPSPPCNDPSLELPIHEYDHGDGNCSITGGYVYRGARVPAAHGLYFFGDWCTGRIWTLEPGGLAVVERTLELEPAAGVVRQLVGFGEDGSGELHVVLSGGSIYRLEPVTDCADGEDDDGDGLVDYPADPGCGSPEAPIENPACNDGIDNDGDGKVDLADPGCSGNPARLLESRPYGCGGGRGGAEAALALPGAFWLRRAGRRRPRSRAGRA